MAKRPAPSEPMPEKRPSLLISRQEAEKQIQNRILEGNEPDRIGKKN